MRQRLIAILVFLFFSVQCSSDDRPPFSMHIGKAGGPGYFKFVEVEQGKRHSIIEWESDQSIGSAINHLCAMYEIGRRRGVKWIATVEEYGRRGRKLFVYLKHKEEEPRSVFTIDKTLVREKEIEIFNLSEFRDVCSRALKGEEVRFGESAA